MLDHRVAVVALFVVGSLAVVGLPGTAHDASGPQSLALGGTAPPGEALVQPRTNGSSLWPYTSATQSVDGRKLAINVLVLGDGAAVRQSLTERTELDWNRTGSNESEADADTHSVVVTDDGIRWSDARGSVRYTYVDTGQDGATGRWVTPDYQLHAGSYLGTRRHVRAYESPRAEDEWTAIQAHAEYWDWFRLRHTVTSVKGAAWTVESEFVGEPFVAEVRREYHGNEGGGNDGWISVIELALAGFAVGASLTRTLPVSSERAREFASRVVAENRRWVPLVASTLVLYLGVRMAGVALEGTFPTVSPKLFAGLLYPVLAVGIPVAAARTARPLDRTPAFALAVVGLGAAFVLDFATLGLESLPIRLVLHRVALLVSLGLVAAGGARRDGRADRRVLALGVVGWVVCLLLPLVGLL